ncbi:apolipoprotein A-I-like [Seriola lalandi dorsalis]|uniref:Apolipoprotein A-I-like n=1 Tax=Seriola lalandi dorsalis TaxID=1841481 RepID=A0A3B4X0B4_SERLL|nr:apolipoprotein A-I-like [Seriola lalandi dorsalis]
MKVLVVLALFSVCNANILWQEPPRSKLQVVEEAFWDYVAKATLTAGDTVKQIRASELGQEVSAKISQSADAVNQYVVAEMKQKMEQSLEEFQTSMIPLTQNFQTQLKQKTQEIQQNLAPYGEELKDKLDTDVQNLKKQLAALWESFTQLTQ